MSEAVKNKRIKPAAWFLFIILAVLLLILGLRVWWEADPVGALRLAYTPSSTFEEDSKLPEPDYSADSGWLVRPGLDNKYTAMRPAGDDLADIDPKQIDIFYIHPTSSFTAKRWNAAFDDTESNARTNALASKSHVTAFAPYGRVFVPAYRQAVFGSFFAKPERVMNSVKAWQLAYADVAASFRYYLKHENNGRPFIIASHSQGTMHALPLILNELKGKPAGERMIAAYLIGWPISIEQDLPALGFPACESADQTGCIISWQTFGYDGDASLLKTYMDTTVAWSGQPRKGTTMLCTNPLTWTVGGSAPASEHGGMVPLNVDSTPMPAPIQSTVGAACVDGILKLDTMLKGSTWEEYQMAGMNMHAYDVNLFYMNLRDNVKTRMQAWMQQ